ncbi:MAG: FMN-binding negative transcriptional regulator [Chitinophagaceae bacterium]|nr:FMN-binding negative transcriptional regulator [Chitinophagaceae bacterium]
MYNLPYYKTSSASELIAFMKEHSFATLMGCEGNRLAATQVPLLIEEREGKLFLMGHIMRKQDHHLAFAANPEVLALFTGPHVYVSATWYSNPHQASTWNYMSVHARGTLRFLDDKGLIEVLRKLTLHYENNESTTTIYDNLTPEYVAPLLKSIIGFEIEVTAIENVFKLSQNRDRESYKNIIKELAKQGGDGEKIAAIMQQRESQLYNDPKE